MAVTGYDGEFVNKLSQIGSEPLRAAFLRDEIPAAMVWLRDEGFEQVDAELLDRYLWTDKKLDAGQLDALVEVGLLRRSDEGRYELTEAGSEHGARVFAHHFSDLEEAPAYSPCGCGCCRGVADPA